MTEFRGELVSGCRLSTICSCPIVASSISVAQWRQPRNPKELATRRQGLGRGNSMRETRDGDRVAGANAMRQDISR